MNLADFNPVDIVKKRQQLAADYRDVFETPQGQRVLAHLAKTSFVFDPTFVQGDPYQTALHEGQRRVVLSIMKFIHMDIAKLLTMSEERAK